MSEGAFLATARIVVRPDTTAFRGLLEAEIRAATAKPFTIPVTPVIVGGTGQAAFTSAQASAAAATQGVAAALEKETISANKATASTKGLASAQTSSAAAAQKLAFAQTEVVGASSAVNAAQVTLTRSSAAVAAAQRAVAAALNNGNASLIASTENTLRNASAHLINTEAALANARAEAALAATRGQAIKGIVAQSAATLGLRAGTLAASSGFIVATVGVLGFVKAVQSAATLETELNVFRVTAKATGDEMERVSETARQLGRDITLPGVTANQAAAALTLLSKAGLSTRDSLDAVRGSLQLATAAQVSNEQAVKLVTNTLGAFELSGTRAVAIADLLTGAADASQGEITELGTALGQVGTVANQFGVSVEDTVTLLTQLAQAGLAGGRAGTTLRVAFLRLVNPGAAAAKVLKELNVENKIFDAQGKLRPQIFSDIQKSLQGYEVGLANAKRATIFGSDAIKVLGAVGKTGASDFSALRDEITRFGLSQEKSAARTAGLTGDVENLKNQVSDLGLSIGNAVKGPLSSLVKSFSKQAEGINIAIGAIDDYKKKLAELGDFKIPGSDETGTSFFDTALRELFTIDPFLAQKWVEEFTKATQFIRDARDNVQREIRIAELARNGGSFGITNLFRETTTPGSKSTSSAASETLKNIESQLGVKQIENILKGFDAQEVRAKIAGNNAQLLTVINDTQDFLEKQLRRGYVKRRPALQRTLELALLGTITDIESLLKQGKADSETIKREAEQAARDREQALLAGQETARSRQQNLIATAEQTPGLKDDLKRQNVFKQILLNQIAAVKEQISLEGGKEAALNALESVLIQVKGAINGVKEKQKENQAAQRQALLQSIDLDISLAQITDNQRAEVAARNKKIVELNKELKKEGDLNGKTTVAYKTIRNEIAAQTAALKEIQGAKQESNNSFAAASFEFLQTQQGFASNLLGNLIPRGATGGLVGGGQSVGAALQPAVGSAEARSLAGPTAGQGNATNHILGSILQQLKILNGDNKAPEAARQNKTQRSTMDYYHTV